MNKLKVIQLLPELNIGGVERGTKDFSNALCEQGHESLVISNGGIFEKEIIANGARHIKLPVHKKNLFFWNTSNKLKKIYEQEKPNIIHIRSRMPAWINYYATKNLSYKPYLISTFHGIYSTPVYSQIMSKVDHTIAISETVKEYILSTYKIPEDRITVIPRGCDTNLFNTYDLSEETISNLENEYPQIKNKLILTLPARISKWKGIDCFIELLSKLDKTKYHGLIVGPTSKSKNKYLSKLKSKIKNLDIHNQITFTGSRNDISDIYKISDIVFNLSIEPEPFGRTTIEAISCGSKVIGWDHGGTKEILEKLYPNGLIKLNDIESLKERVIEVSELNYPKPNINIFTSEKMISSTIELYYKLLSN